jgi:hypothetical protein
MKKEKGRVNVIVIFGEVFLMSNPVEKFKRKTDLHIFVMGRAFKNPLGQ